jgi:hypothetical protein
VGAFFRAENVRFREALVSPVVNNKADNILAYLLKARTVKPAETAVAKERLCKH